jgi:REP element-mobilizing transposase RayT
MVIAYHSIFCAYGFWLPNDPRGSWSEAVRKWELLRFGPATKTTTRRSIAGRSHDRQLRRKAKETLDFPPVSFTGVQARAIGRGFANAVERSGFRIHACSILPEHVHVVISRPRYDIEIAVGPLKGEATKQLIEEGLHPLAQFPGPPSPWARKGWHVYLNTVDDVLRSIRYVEGNPRKEGKPEQRWPFVVPWEDSCPIV